MNGDVGLDGGRVDGALTCEYSAGAGSGSSAGKRVVKASMLCGEKKLEVVPA